MPQATITVVPAFTVRELTGSRRTVQLLGRALPQGPYELKGKFRVQTTWLPGYSEATQTKLGSSEDPTTVQGVWKDKYLASTVDVFEGQLLGTVAQAPAQLDGDALESVDALCLLMDDIRRQGQDVEVTWGTLARVGTLEEFTQRWRNVHDVEWSMTFQWRSQAERPPNPVFGLESSVSDTATTLAQRMAALLAAVQTSLTIVQTYVDLVQGAVTALAATVSAYQNLVGALDEAVTDPGDSTRRALGLCTALIEQANTLLVLTVADPPRAILLAATNPVDPLFPAPGQILRAVAYQQALHDGAQEIRDTAAFQRAVLQDKLRANLISEYVVRGGDNLRTISQQFYDTPDGWRRIAQFNNLASSDLLSGQRLLIPRADRGGV